MSKYQKPRAPKHGAPKLGAGPPIWVSQNFLTAGKTIHRLIRKTSINSNDHVIEIGPGKGHIKCSLAILQPGFRH